MSRYNGFTSVEKGQCFGVDEDLDFIDNAETVSAEPDNFEILLKVSKVVSAANRNISSLSRVAYEYNVDATHMQMVVANATIHQLREFLRLRFGS